MFIREVGSVLYNFESNEQFKQGTSSNVLESADMY